MPACDDLRVEEPTGSQRLALARHLGDAASVEVWARTKTIAADGRESVEVRQTDDRALLARLDELTSENYFDPEVQVLVEDFSDGAEDGSWSAGTRVSLRRRTLETEDDLRRNIERSGRSYEDWQAEQRMRAVPVRPTRVELLESDLRAAEEAGEQETIIIVELRDKPSIDLPPRHTSPVPQNDIEKLDARLERTEAIAARGQEILELQQPFSEWLEVQDAEILVRYWSKNALALRAPAELMRAIYARPDVESVHRSAPITPDGVIDRYVIRDSERGIQADQFWWAGFDGQATSSRNSNGLWIGIVELGDGLSTNHQGFDDNSIGYSRVESTWDCDSSPCDTSLDACTLLHGMTVASIAVADFMQDQHPNVTGSEQARRTGIARESFVSLVSYSGGEAGMRLAVEKAMADNLDIVNHSAGSCCCDPVGDTADEINDAYFDGILWINSHGNGELCNQTECNSNVESAASGSIAVASHDSYDDGTPDQSINDARMCYTKSSYGYSEWGVIPDLAAPGGAYRPMDCVDGFQADTDPCGGTSLAAPHVTGASALLMDHWIETFSDATAHQPGRMHAVLLGMADGCGDTLGIDPRWGAGRLKLRKFDGPGMDGPYRMRTRDFGLTSTDWQESWYLKEDANGFLAPLSSDVDAFIATAFCRHDDLSAYTGELGMDVYDVDTDTFAVWSDQRGEKGKITFKPQAHRYIYRLFLTDIPVGENIRCYTMWAWEDSDRDDGDGPAPDIDPWYVLTNPPGPTAPSCDSC